MFICSLSFLVSPLFHLLVKRNFLLLFLLLSSQLKSFFSSYLSSCFIFLKYSFFISISLLILLHRIYLAVQILAVQFYTKCWQYEKWKKIKYRSPFYFFQLVRQDLETMYFKAIYLHFLRQKEIVCMYGNTLSMGMKHKIVYKQDC